MSGFSLFFIGLEFSKIPFGVYLVLMVQKQGRSRVGSALLSCLLFDRVQNILQDLSSGLVCRFDSVCVNLACGGRVRVSQPRRNGGQACTCCDEQRCIRVPQRMNVNRRQSVLGDELMKPRCNYVRSNGCAIPCGEQTVARSAARPNQPSSVPCPAHAWCSSAEDPCTADLSAAVAARSA